MSSRANSTSARETVEDLDLAAHRRLREAKVLFDERMFHTSIYLAGLSAEMLLKTACYCVEGATPTDPAETHIRTARPGKHYQPPFVADFEAGHGLLFWSHELIARRQRHGLSGVPKSYLQICSSLYDDWWIAMRYRPGSASPPDARDFLSGVDWLALHHATLPR